ncbi:MAG: WGxxGxxG family protein [Microcoleaceae cyanobacterium]
MLSTLSKAICTGTFALSVATLLLTLPASAQTGTPGDASTPSTTNYPTSTQEVDSVRDDRGFDWGWIGLFGLAGLAGLTRKPEQAQIYRDPNDTTRPSSTSRT